MCLPFNKLSGFLGVCLSSSLQVLPDDNALLVVAVKVVGDYFGEMALLDSAHRMASVMATLPTICMTVDRQTFAKALGPLQSLLERAATRRKNEVAAITQHIPCRECLAVDLV